MCRYHYIEEDKDGLCYILMNAEDHVTKLSNE